MIVSNIATFLPAFRSDGQGTLITVLLLAVVLAVEKGAKKDVSPIWLILISAVLGMVVYSI